MIRNIGDFKPFGVERLPESSNYRYKLQENGVELSWSKNELIWSKNRCLLHHFTMSGEIIEATLCIVDETQYLAILYKSGLALYTLSGQSYLIPLPFQISMIYPLNKALLLIRETKSTLYQMDQYCDFPIIFTLFHPLEEIRPVAYTSHLNQSSLPKFTTIQSPSARDGMTTPPAPSFANINDQDLSFITDKGFMPLQVSTERCYLLASTQNEISIWKFNEPQGNRDLLYSSPHFVKSSPSIFSPPVRTKNMLSPGAAARAEIKATLEGIPPDLFMEVVLDFPQKAENCKAHIYEVSKENRHLILILHGNQLSARDITYVDEVDEVFTLDNVESICSYKDLMFFVVYTDGSVVLHEEDRSIVNLPFMNVTEIHKLGRYFVKTCKDGSHGIFSFEMTFDRVVAEVLDVAHMVLSPQNYATVVLSLSTSNAFSDCETFLPSFFTLLTELEEESTVMKFIKKMHLFYEELRVQEDRISDSNKLLELLISLAKYQKLPNFILYYGLHKDKMIKCELEEDYTISSDPVSDLMTWCSQCIAGTALEPLKKAFPLTKKLMSIFGNISFFKNSYEIVINTEKSKLTLNDINKLRPALSIPLKRAFYLTAQNPPSNWPLAAYRLIGREDIAVLQEYLMKPTFDNITYIQQPDLRFIEVERLLQSHLPVTIDVERPNGVDDIQYQSMLNAKLKIVLSKQWSLSVGRGLFNYKTFTPLSSQGIEKNEINRKGFTVNSIEMNIGDEGFDELSEWPNFHNGVSCGLTITDADRSWLLDAATSAMSPFIAGVVFAFGVNGLLRKFWKMDIYAYLTDPDIKETNAIAMLLGLGLAFRGKKDLGISHMLTLHIPELRQFQQTEFDISTLVRASAILGMGFLFEGSGQRHITETFISLMERSAVFDLPTLPFVLGASIGLVNLGMGDESAVMRENRERLCVVFSGNKSIDVSNEKIATFGNSDFFAVSPASILALTLGYMRTDHERLKAALALPNDASFINAMLPDVVLMRTMSSLMIDSDPNTALNMVIPDNLSCEILCAFVTGFAIACGVKFAGSLNKKAFVRLQSIAKCLCLLEKQPFDFTDCPMIRREEALCTVVLSCSLIIAGTCDVDFLQFVRYVRRRSLLANMTQYVYGIHMTLSMAIGVLNIGKGRYTLGQSNKASASILISMFPRFARYPNDNDFALQPVRHLLAAAAVPHVIEVRDVDTNEITPIYVRIGLKGDGNEFAIKTPHVLPPYNTIESIQIDDPLYYSVDRNPFPYTNDDVRPIFWVKKRTEANEVYHENIDNIRNIFKMAANPIFEISSTTENDNLIKTKNLITWDENSEEIIQFFRTSSTNERLRILEENQFIKDFLIFYGISPSCSINDLAVIDDEALSILISKLTQKEIEEILY